MPSIIQTVQNIYTYIISISGIIALAALIWAGILYLTSTGKPEKLEKAKKQILACFFGIIILFASYLILRTINPELVKLQLPRLKEIIFHPLQAPPSETLVPEFLGKVREMADKIKEEVIPGVENSSQKIKELTENCKCENTQSLCLCTGGDEKAKCEPNRCYAGPGFQPCPDEKEIKENQQNIIAWRDEILYYRNRALEEIKDLEDERKKVLDEKIVYYTKIEIIEEDEEVKQFFRDERKKVTEEKNLKKDLATKLKELADKIKEIEPFISEIGILPDKCLYDEGVYGVNNKCNAHCKGECHDYKNGCQPDKCSGGNPCPVGEINDQFLIIQNIRPSIDQIGQEILNIIEEIIKLKTITI
ncbi:MAG: hypothetical protein COU42_02165 [Candidatus Nealsonbacteria bacterium CG10_big_fil_rev_8_21_14_0_10_36_24]|uniref:Uncharacterized protein n=2 Tax=Candidatus Nealsoniibacteriota TaxID=1817911 RepID=A0A2H0YNL3_9BACT|nr:MAG: hypothetical protein COU42_02165 [Candidatus Nealsonbacteria bacterium CG10_big_fil_rev_8_21_14_0_10_36_24]PIS40016.1 MAG: hypothetical protein COT32_02105 [Candidatus Nealsonbacteria bacterium CG08_land_8_20_14_0_20_36_22]